LSASLVGETYYIGIDVGTTHIKSAVFSENGTLVEILKSQTPINKDQYGQVYLPILLYETVQSQIAVLLEKYENIEGISITGMAEAGLIINKTTKMEETPIIPWFDKRTTELSCLVTEREERCNFNTTGLRNSYKYGIYKFLWLLKHHNINNEEAIWLSVCDYVLFKLSGQFVTDPSFAARTYVYDIMKNCWDKKRLEAYGLTDTNFPQVVCSGEKAGYLSDPYLKDKVHNKEMIICIGGHDHICAAYAVIQEDQNRICNSVGTAETYLGMVKNLLLDETLYDSGMVYGPFFDNKNYYWMANISSSGQSVEWFRKNIQKNEIEYGEMNEKLLSMTEEPTDIIFLPFLSGIGTPLFQPEVSGAFLGLRANHNQWDMLKAILEGINYQGRWVLSLVPEITLSEKELICVGGATDSEPWMQMKANILEIPVKIPKVTEATLLGAVAIMIHRNYGIKNKLQFLETNNQVTKSYSAVESVSKMYQEIYRNKYTFLIDMIIKQELCKKE
jgi:xylulokinase